MMCVRNLDFPSTSTIDKYIEMVFVVQLVYFLYKNLIVLLLFIWRGAPGAAFLFIINLHSFYNHALLLAALLLLLFLFGMAYAVFNPWLARLVSK